MSAMLFFGWYFIDTCFVNIMIETRSISYCIEETVMFERLLAAIGRCFVSAVATATYWLAAGFGLFFYVPLFGMIFGQVENHTAFRSEAILSFGLFLSFAIVHCVWMWIFYKVNVLERMFQSSE
mgnify:CR=1 FL=1